VRRRSWLIGKTIRATAGGGEVFGRAADLNHEGHLVLVLPDGSSRALSSADDVRWVV
jgi:biotin-(acetyl-CoA carboxylase) ligase